MSTRSAPSGRNPNGEGTIYQREDGRFEAATYVTISDGTRKRIRLYGRTWEEVHRPLVEVKAQEHRGIPSQPVATRSGPSPTTGWRTSRHRPYARRPTPSTRPSSGST